MKKRVDKSGEENMPDLIVLTLQTLGMNPFDKLVELCEPITYSVIKKYFLKDYERSDFLQEARSVLVRATRDWRVTVGMSFTQYYHMQLTNHLNMLIRKKRAQKRKVNEYTESLDNLVQEAGVHIEGTSNPATQPEEVVIARETYSEYLAELSELEARVNQLFMNNTSFEGMSEKLNITNAQARSALYRCRTKLSGLIDKTF